MARQPLLNSWEVTKNRQVRIQRFESSVFNSNSYVIDNGVVALIIDIGDFDSIRLYIDSERLTLSALFITHTHYDHIFGISKFLSHYPSTPIYTSEFGKMAFNNPKWNFSRYHEDVIAIESNNIRILQSGDTLNIAPKLFVNVLATPGHDSSCLSYIIDDNLFTGDSYIPGVKVVATFPKSDKLLASQWYTELALMSSLFNIYPGHGLPLIHRNLI